MARMSPAQRRELLVQAAVRVIARDGVSAATTRAIVAEADMSLASFHYAFASHDEMMRGVIEFVVGSQREAALGAIVPGDDIRTLLGTSLMTFLDQLVGDPRWELALLELAQYALRTPGLDDLVRQQWGAYRAVIEHVLVAGAAMAEVRWTMPVPDVARLVLIVTDGVTLAWLADRDTDAARRALEHAADAFASLAEPLSATPNDNRKPMP